MRHHAYLLIGEREEADSFLDQMFLEFGISKVGNPDIALLESDVFGVLNARALSERASGKAFGERKIFIIHSNQFTREAQNALLKTLEDPVEMTQFFITVREEGVLLPTLLSRLEVVRLESKRSPNAEAKKFLSKSLKQRVDFAKKFALEMKSDEGEAKRGAGELALFLDSLLLLLKEEGRLDALKKVSKLREYARDSSAMPRVILEHIALVI